jgi:hypothetical protein
VPHSVSEERVGSIGKPNRVLSPEGEPRDLPACGIASLT